MSSSTSYYCHKDLVLYLVLYCLCRFDLEMEFKALSKKISSARLGAKVKCEFIKEGKVEYVD